MSYADDTELIEQLSARPGYQPWRSAFGAATKANVTLFKWITSRFALDLSTVTPSLESTWKGIVQGGSLELTQIAHAQCATFVEHLATLVDSAVRYGHLPLVQYLLGLGTLDLNRVLLLHSFHLIHFSQ